MKDVKNVKPKFVKMILDSQKEECGRLLYISKQDVDSSGYCLKKIFKHFWHCRLMETQKFIGALNHLYREKHPRRMLKTTRVKLKRR